MMRHKIISTLFCVPTSVASVLSIASCNNTNPDVPFVSQVVINGPQNLFLGDTAKYVASVVGAYGVGQEVVWSLIDDVTGSSIDQNGNFVAGHKTGIVSIVATSVYDASVSTIFELTISSHVRSVNIKNKINSILFGDAHSFKWTIDADEGYKDVIWSIENPEQHTSSIKSDGTFLAGNSKDELKVIVTSATDPTFYDECVLKISSTIISVNIEDKDFKHTCYCNETLKLTANVECIDEHEDERISWEIKDAITGNESFATINDGIVAASNVKETVLVIVRSVVDPSVYDWTIIYIDSSIISMEFTNVPQDNTLKIKTSNTFGYEITTVPQAPQPTIGVKWEIIEDEDGTGSSIDQNGKFTAGSKPGSVVIRITSNDFPTDYREITIEIVK